MASKSEFTEKPIIENNKEKKSKLKINFSLADAIALAILTVFAFDFSSKSSEYFIIASVTFFLAIPFIIFINNVFFKKEEDDDNMKFILICVSTALLCSFIFENIRLLLIEKGISL